MAQIRKHNCTCDGSGWFRNKDREWDLCLAGCEPPPPADFTAVTKRRGILGMMDEYNATVKGVA